MNQIEKDQESARQGETGQHVRWIMLVSTGLAGLALLGALVFVAI